MIELREIDIRHTRDLVHQCLYTPAVWAFTRYTSRPIAQLSMPLIRYGGPSLWRTLAMAGHFSLWRPFAMAGRYQPHRKPKLQTVAKATTRRKL